MIARAPGAAPHCADCGHELARDRSCPSCADLARPSSLRPVVTGACATALPMLGEMLAPALERARRRAAGLERPIALPWRSVDEHFGGGLWPGLHVLNAGTGRGKTQWALQVATHAAERGAPVAYIGLELGRDEIAMRELGLAARVPWSALFTGQAGHRDLAAAENAVAGLTNLPFHVVFGDPYGWHADRLFDVARAMRARYPDEEGASPGPILLVVDFLQLLGNAPGDRLDLRERIARASYVSRAVARDLDVAVLAISSIAREKYDLAALAQRAGLEFDVDESRAPINRRIRTPEPLVGVGKESGEIEFSADSVSVLVPVLGRDGAGTDVVLATPKGRATSTRWSPLQFDGFRFSEPTDRGAGVVDTWREASRGREEARASKLARRIETSAEAALSRAVAAASYVQANPGCTVREVRMRCGNDSRTWAQVKEMLGVALFRGSGRGGLQLDPVALPEEVRRALGPSPTPRDGVGGVGAPPPHPPLAPHAPRDAWGRGD